MAEKWQLVWAGKEVTNRQRSSLESLWMGDIIKATFWNLFTFIHFPWNPRATISIFFSVITQFLGTWYVHSDLFLLILFRKLAYLGPKFKIQLMMLKVILGVWMAFRIIPIVCSFGKKCRLSSSPPRLLLCLRRYMAKSPIESTSIVH